MAVLSAQQIVRTGLAGSYQSCASGGDRFANDGRKFIEVVNATGSSRTVTIVTADTAAGLAIADATVVVGAASRRKIGPFLKDPYNTASGFVDLTYSAISGLTIGLFYMSTT